MINLTLCSLLLAPGIITNQEPSIIDYQTQALMEQVFNPCRPQVTVQPVPVPPRPQVIYIVPPQPIYQPNYKRTR
jgi:hypothetical protein